MCSKAWRRDQFIDSAGKYNRRFSGQADNEKEHKTDRDRIAALELELHLHGPQVIEIKAVLPTARRRSPCARLSNRRPREGEDPDTFKTGVMNDVRGEFVVFGGFAE